MRTVSTARLANTRSNNDMMTMQTNTSASMSSRVKLRKARGTCAKNPLVRRASTNRASTFAEFRMPRSRCSISRLSISKIQHRFSLLIPP
ncbi:hypothetical protein [Saltwater crocodilepox virus]|nr:hypothetical protein [Saltwater crocodilepox virus]AVD69441.1 hypothetical protein [Saltwater crocodilepox virus]QGT46545.1 ORF106 [Saltwater crocodilepox virus]QGT46761.1 ORF106 [Saltwater crocodilepox virus]QGT46977.1 ORF106 [Saltwater crocodilepox virus]